MKKAFIFLMILTLGWLGSASGQNTKYPPVRPYNLEGYVVEDFVEFALQPTAFSENFQKELLSYVNRFLKDTGLDEKYGKMEGEEGILWIFSPERTWVENRTYERGFWNTHKDRIKIVPYWDERLFDGSIMVLHVDGYELDLAKDICMNLVNIPYKVPVAEKGEKEETRSNEVVEKTGYSKNILLPIDDGGGDLVEDPNDQQTEIDLGIKNERTRSRFYYWQKKNGRWAYPVTGFLFGTATGFVANKQGYYWYKWFPKPIPPHGTMSNGRAGTNGETSTTEGEAGRKN